ncbi:C40 family peptidase [Neolewinella antarctica]|uniref:NlpC/P60 domain-containing protein n=1 Tax=Neolewinella antarctica TaxID=442734 RepID=A0ABX0X5Z4_9BACT|nr:NlpC/P60 family protein [Neolewinella antarctica]NJC24623.1 hypothetical protein [Neolewinella antarctica]
MTHFAIGRYAAAAIRARPRVDGELVSQILFGEPVIVLQDGKQFCRVRCGDDDFEGFVRADQLLSVDERTYLAQVDDPAFNLDLFSVIMSERAGIPITFGARLTGFDGLRLNHGGTPFNYTGQAALGQDLRTDAELLVRLARKWLFVPGQRRGRTPTGVDATSLVQLVCRVIGLRLPRTAPAMAKEGRSVDFMEQAQLADLAFFDNRKGEIDHVGILFPDSTILHVHDRVRIDAVDHFGIFNYESGRYTHRLRILKRLLPNDEKPGILRTKQERVADAAANQMLIF